MRTIALLSTIALAGFAAANPLLREAQTASVTYEETLQCAGCIRGGYVFCGKTKVGTKCMKPEDKDGIKALQDAEWNCDNGVVAKPGYDVTLALHNDNQTQGDVVFNYEFGANETESYLHETVDGAFTYKYPGLDDNSTNNCGSVNNTVRKMYVMITNLQKPEPVTPTLAAEARMLAEEVNKTFLNATVSFAAVEGRPDSAMTLFSAVAVAIVACLSVFVF
ncbi:hypothetical protein FGO68_gene10360 [Halteria grandinella]|uniref:Uncharacterized protein n=1 Tax=Halteria grandinella TaxID=5974 RepID=A0A8J8NKQ9_HALGN|nr:hypothetical protein FGO68_gene10360 [Halteria grandinella]